jgi:hypothetical protein
LVPSKRGLFKVKSFFWSLVCSEGCHFPWKSVRRTKAPLRAVFFTWSAALSKILIMDNLKKQHVIMVDKSYICNRNGEYVNLLLLHCDMAYAIWIDFFSCSGLS